MYETSWSDTTNWSTVRITMEYDTTQQLQHTNTQTHSKLGSVLLELIERPRSERVRAHHGHLPPFPLPVMCKLRDCRRLSCALRTEHDASQGRYRVCPHLLPPFHPPAPHTAYPPGVTHQSRGNKDDMRCTHTIGRGTWGVLISSIISRMR